LATNRALKTTKLTSDEVKHQSISFSTRHGRQRANTARRSGGNGGRASDATSESRPSGRGYVTGRAISACAFTVASDHRNGLRMTSRRSRGTDQIASGRERCCSCHRLSSRHGRCARREPVSSQRRVGARARLRTSALSHDAYPITTTPECPSTPGRGRSRSWDLWFRWVAVRAHDCGPACSGSKLRLCGVAYARAARQMPAVRRGTSVPWCVGRDSRTS
jgi:hypothetical protein